MSKSLAKKQTKPIIMACDGACVRETRAGGYGFFTGTEMVCGPLSDVTSNMAEYEALERLLKYIEDEGIKDDIVILSDSDLMVNQISGAYAVRNPELRKRCSRVATKIRNSDNIKLVWVSRSKLTGTDRASKSGLKSEKEIRYPALNP